MNVEECMLDSWKTKARWKGITRPYSPEDVLKLRGPYKIEHTIADMMSKRLWQDINSMDYVHALGAVSGNQAIQQVQAGLPAIYCSGWQIAADGNLGCDMYPDMSIYPSNSGPAMVRRINNALLRTSQVNSKKHLAPVVADGEAGFGGNLNVYELTRQFIEAGAAGFHFEDQLSSAKKCGHMGGKVAVPTCEFIKKLIAARLSADVCGVPIVLIARTDCNAAQMLTSDIDEYDKPFLTGERTPEGFYRFNGGIDAAIARGLAYSPFCDLVWCETAHPDLGEAKKFAEAVHAQYPGKMLAYNCSPSFKWTKYLDNETIAKFQRELGAMGYKFQFITLAGFHSLNFGMFDLARKYRDEDMSAYVRLQEYEFESEEFGYQAVAHQNFVGAGHFDDIMNTVMEGNNSMGSMQGSTEEEQF